MLKWGSWDFPSGPVVRALWFPCRGTGTVSGQGTKISPAAQNSQHFFFLMGPNMWAWEHLVPNYTRLPRFLLCPPPVGQGSGTKEKFLVLLVLGLLISWVPSTWHHSFGTQAIQGLGGHRTPQLPRMPGAGGPSDAVADACAGSSRGGWRPLSPLLPLFLPRWVYLWLACGSCPVLGLWASVLQKTPPHLSVGNTKFSGQPTDQNASELELLHSEELFIELW